MKAPTTLAKLLLIAVVTGAATTGCATGGTLSSRAVADRQTAVRIRNYNWSDVKVYLVPASGGLVTASGGRPVRIGTVTSMTTVQIPLRGALAQIRGRLQFLIKPLASSTSYITHSVVVVPGDVLRLTVENQLTLSTLVRSW